MSSSLYLVVLAEENAVPPLGDELLARWWLPLLVGHASAEQTDRCPREQPRTQRARANNLGSCLAEPKVLITKAFLSDRSGSPNQPCVPASYKMDVSGYKGGDRHIIYIYM